jgi:hypothetical protein
MELYAEAFDNAGALDKLEGFASFHGPDFYGLPRNTGTITLRRESWTPPEQALPLAKPTSSRCALAKRAVAPGVERIDWAAPWLQPWQAQAPWATAGRGAASAQVCQCHAEALNAAGPARRCALCPRAICPPGQAYEQFIFDTGCVPTRDNLHDFFNGLVWLHFRRPSGASTSCRPRRLRARRRGPVRGPLRDALTVFDENGALLQAPAALWQALRARDWQRFFIELRPLWARGAGVAVRPRPAGKAGFTTKTDHSPRLSSAQAIKS